MVTLEPLHPHTMTLLLRAVIAQEKSMYVSFLKTLKAKVTEQSPDMTFPEISYTAWTQKDSKADEDSNAWTNRF